MIFDTVKGIAIPFLGTSLGAACVFFMRSNLNMLVQRALTGFAAGVMTAASVWSLLIPAIEQSASMGRMSFVPAAVGFLAGIAFLLLLDHIIPHLHMNSEQSEGPKSHFRKTTMLVLAVTLHNIPEGMAVGFVIPAMPYLLSFAAGAMIYVVVEELIPEMSAGEHTNIGTIMFAVGFVLMMALDVSFS